MSTSEISHLTLLRTLDLRATWLLELPQTLPQMKFLETLEVNGNPLKSPPLSIVSRGLPHIMAYLVSQASGFRRFSYIFQNEELNSGPQYSICAENLPRSHSTDTPISQKIPCLPTPLNERVSENLPHGSSYPNILSSARSLFTSDSTDGDTGLEFKCSPQVEMMTVSRLSANTAPNESAKKPVMMKRRCSSSRPLDALSDSGYSTACRLGSRGSPHSASFGANLLEEIPSKSTVTPKISRLIKPESLVENEDLADGSPLIEENFSSSDFDHIIPSADPLRSEEAIPKGYLTHPAEQRVQRKNLVQQPNKGASDGNLLLSNGVYNSVRGSGKTSIDPPKNGKTKPVQSKHTSAVPSARPSRSHSAVTPTVAKNQCRTGNRSANLTPRHRTKVENPSHNQKSPSQITENRTKKATELMLTSTPKVPATERPKQSLVPAMHERLPERKFRTSPNAVPAPTRNSVRTPLKTGAGKNTEAVRISTARSSAGPLGAGRPEPTRKSSKTSRLNSPGTKTVATGSTASTPDSVKHSPSSPGSDQAASRPKGGRLQAHNPSVSRVGVSLRIRPEELIRSSKESSQCVVSRSSVDQSNHTDPHSPLTSPSSVDSAHAGPDWDELTNEQLDLIERLHKILEADLRLRFPSDPKQLARTLHTGIHLIQWLDHLLQPTMNIRVCIPRIINSSSPSTNSEVTRQYRQNLRRCREVMIRCGIPKDRLFLVEAVVSFRKPAGILKLAETVISFKEHLRRSSSESSSGSGQPRIQGKRGNLDTAKHTTRDISHSGWSDSLGRKEIGASGPGEAIDEHRSDSLPSAAVWSNCLCSDV
ncbi:unnamed protein product [Calicophoron daubneyi]|uniref:Uncharacterized protein n=1 Tax=Calicophoron daubneyi TaxID=300641 RepID=A0AAV2TDX0_CALDB